MNKGVILLVEDNPDDVALTRRAFANNKITNELIEARDGVEAIDYLFGTGAYAGRNTAILPAIILLDLHLPRLDGLEVLKRIRSDPRTKRVCVVILSSSIEDRDVCECYAEGANSYVHKPVDFDELISVIGCISLYWLTVNRFPAFHVGGHA